MSPNSTVFDATRYIVKIAISGLILFGDGGTSWAVPTGSELSFRSSDHRLEQSFNWAKHQALAYVRDGSDPVGAWYEASLPGRNAFCMRDVAHQVAAAAEMGLDEANLNMLRHFSAAVSPERNWAGYWEIDVLGNPSDEDYLNDQMFWYNLPANFDVLDAAFRLSAWTGDSSYINDPAIKQFFSITANEYLNSWDLRPHNILTRPRIMNNRAPEEPLTFDQAYLIRARGIPSYFEERTDFNLGVDLLAVEYRAFTDLAVLARGKHDTEAERRYSRMAQQFSDLIEKYGWFPEDHHYIAFLPRETGKASGVTFLVNGDKKTQRVLTGDPWVLYYGAVHNPEHIRAAVDYMKSAYFLDNIGIEVEAYLPKVFFTYGEKAAAYDRIFSLSRPGKPRREYPEVSYSVVDAIVGGVMGISTDPAMGPKPGAIHTLSRLLNDSDEATIYSVHIQGGMIDVSHLGNHQTTFRNHTAKPLLWQAEFAGVVNTLSVNGTVMKALLRHEPGIPVTSSVMVTVAPNAEATVVVAP